MLFLTFLKRLRPRIVRLIALSCLLGMVGTPALSDEYSDVTKLIKANQMAEAMAKTEQTLNAKPRDPQMRFLKGVIQSETNKVSDAIQTFTKLTEDYPELPEPYNNLAVLYAGSNQYDKARAALEMAIKTNPSYSTAHENLGDLYAKMASQAYTRALQLDATNKDVPPKLALIRELFSAPSLRNNSTTTKAAAPTATTAQPASPVKAPSPVPPPVTTPAIEKPPAPASTAMAPRAAEVDSRKSIEAALQGWANAWSAQDIKAYFASYSKDFAPANKASRAAWEIERKDRIMSKAHISVKLSQFSTTVTGNTATVVLRQDYKADTLVTSSRKRLELVKTGDRWLITKEISG